MTRSAVLAGRTVADAVRNLFVIVLMVAVGAAVGFRFHAGAVAALAAVGLAVAVGFSLSWVNALLGLVIRDSESAGLAGLLATIPLIFTSSIFVPVATMPGWLQAFAKVNLISVVVDALRVLSLGGPTIRSVIEALAWILALLAATGPATVRVAQGRRPAPVGPVSVRRGQRQPDHEPSRKCSSHPRCTSRRG